MNPLEFKHRMVGAPLKEIIRRMGPSEEWTDEGVMVALYVGAWTAAFNLYPAAALIQAGVRGETVFSHITYKRFNPWAQPIFHYITPASKAERFGGVVGGKVGGRAMLELSRYGTPFGKGMQKAWQKAGAKAGVKIGARIGGRLIPGVGWALLAYDVYDIAYNRSLWGFDLS